MIYRDKIKVMGRGRIEGAKQVLEFRRFCF